MQEDIHIKAARMEGERLRREVGNPSGRSLMLQAILYFTMAKMGGFSREDAVKAFCDSDMCRSFGEHIAGAHVDDFASAGGYRLAE